MHACVNTRAVKNLCSYYIYWQELYLLNRSSDKHSMSYGLETFVIHN
jgi:hypothetical protein